MTVVTTFPKKIREIETLWIPLADGVQLAARVWMPEDAEQNPVPAILEYIPYRRRDGTRDGDDLTHPYFAGHGYACVRLDIRGSGDSDGLILDEYLKQEQDDAVEAIAWIAQQPWCTGKVGMMGISWGGFNSLQVAARHPEALKAIISVDSTDDRYADDMHYMGGQLINGNLEWGSSFFSRVGRAPDPRIVGEKWRKMWLDRLEHVEPFHEIWMRHQWRDEFWQHGSVCEDFSQIKCAVFAVGGWADGYSNAIFRLLEKLKTPRLGLCGPWGHKYPHNGVPGPAIGFLQEALRWWDHWLKDKDTGIMAEPMLRAYVQDSVPPKSHYDQRPGRWVAERAWPRPGLRPTRLVFGDGRLGSAARNEGESRICSPQTTGGVAGEWCPYGLGGLGPELPMDQREDDANSLTWDSPPLEEAMEILGRAGRDLDRRLGPPRRHGRRPSLRCRARRRLDARHLWRAQPHPSREPCRTEGAQARRVLPGHGSAERLRPPLRRRQSHPRRRLDGLLADGLALAGGGDAHHPGRAKPYRSAGPRRRPRRQRRAASSPP